MAIAAEAAAAVLLGRRYEPPSTFRCRRGAGYLAVSCKMRHRSYSSQQRRQQAQKIAPNQTSLDIKSEAPGEKSSDVSIPSTSTALQPHQKLLPGGGDINSDVASVKNGMVPTSEEEEVEKSEDAPDVSHYQPQDLVGMIRNSEKNVLLLNQARVRALEDVGKILTEKEALQAEISLLEAKLAESDARLKFATAEKVHSEILGDQIERLRKEVSSGSTIEVNNSGGSCDSPLVEELNVLREENALLKADIKSLKVKLTEVSETEERVLTLERERFFLESSLRELESRFTAAQTDVSKLAPLQNECKALWEKVEHLQGLLDNAAKQTEQAGIVLQQNRDLQDKVDKLEAATTSKYSNHFDDLLQQKVKTLEERLRVSDQEIHSQIQLYQKSVEEFQDTLSKLTEESERRSHVQPAHDMPTNFWSRLLLMIDGWLLEKKISSSDAKLLREMTWKRDHRIRDAYFSCKNIKENEAVGKFLNMTLSRSSDGLHIVHIAAEMAPVAKVGGLADVVSGLGKALQKKGHLVEVILPKYDCMQYDQVDDFKVLNAVVQSYFDGNLFENKIWTGTVEGLPVYFIEPHHPGKFFWRGQYYGEHDDFKRFSYFSRAALELLFEAGKKPDIIHCHDWQTAFVAPLYWDVYANKGFNSSRICFTCHNFEYQGTAPAPDLASCGLDVGHLDRPDRMQDSAHGRINAVKGAIVYSNIVTTVSPTYALEVRSPEGGRGLQDVLKSHSRKFVGVLNGIDTETWNPSTDGFITVQYNADDLQGKAANKEAIRKQLKLSRANPSQPLVSCITRLVPQKGVHLIRHAIYRTAELGGQFVLLGSSPVPHIQREFEGIANNFREHPHIRLILKYDDALSHLIYAASDMLVIPSIFEPCGLTQMIAMRYGSVPIVRRTGGLNDSVFDVDDDTVPLEMRNGFTFVKADEQALSTAIERAFNYYTKKPAVWEKLVQKVMRIDSGWDSSAAQYEELYERAVARARASAQT